MILDWDNYFMNVARLSAFRSKDPSTQVGACIVNEKKHIVATGYNGMPNGCHDQTMCWEKETDSGESKYLYVVHAELNAILNSEQNLKGTSLYVSLFPCNECAKAIIQAGIKEVVYLEDKYKDTKEVQASKYMLELAGVERRQLMNFVDVLQKNIELKEN
ncbi:MAG: deoxycytidylate deaminase [Cellulosilyticaceae bacterium]